jgi:predicted TIM-barrel fold metal-dependent hydrolase
MTVSQHPIVDAHHHIWRVAHTPWLSGPMQPRIFGEYSAMRRDYTVDEYMSDATPCGVTKSVYVQVNVAPDAEVDEVAWVQSVGAANGFPHGIVGYADLTSADVAVVLDRELACSHLRGIRQQLHWHENAMYRFAPRPDVMNEARFRAGLRQLAARNLVFELQVFASQMKNAARLAADFPEITFVLLHAGMLEDRTPEGWRRWREAMALLAANRNVCVKLSGLGTFVRSCSVELWKPVVEETLEMFGAQRCLFGSNFPIEKLWTDFPSLWAAHQQALAPFSAAERDAIHRGTATRLYRL